jgi:hypothetical protein
VRFVSSTPCIGAVIFGDYGNAAGLLAGAGACCLVLLRLAGRFGSGR